MQSSTSFKTLRWESKGGGSITLLGVFKTYTIFLHNLKNAYTNINLSMNKLTNSSNPFSFFFFCFLTIISNSNDIRLS